MRAISVARAAAASSSTTRGRNHSRGAPGQVGLRSGYARRIVTTISDFVSHSEGASLSPVNLAVRIAFNPWFVSVVGIISMVTIILAGAGIVREHEHRGPSLCTPARYRSRRAGCAIERVVISRTTIEIELAEGRVGDDHNRILIIPWTPPGRPIDAARSTRDGTKICIQGCSANDDPELRDGWTIRFGDWSRIGTIKFPQTTIGGFELALKLQRRAVERNQN